MWSTLKNDIGLPSLLLMTALAALAVTTCSNETHNRDEVFSYPTPDPSATPDLSIATEIEKDRLRDEGLILNEFDAFAAKSSIVGLRKKKLAKDAMEIRIWIGISPDDTRGIVMSQSDVKYLPPIGDVGREKLQSPIMLSPIEGQQKFWIRVEDSGILSIPPESIADKTDPQQDGNIVVVEVKRGSGYKYIVYGSLCRSRSRSAHQLIAAISSITQDLNFNFFNC